MTSKTVAANDARSASARAVTTLPGESRDLGSVPLEWLESELTSMAASIAAATAQWLGWLAVYDRREGYLTWGCRSAAHWLNWKCAMSLKTAHEHVRVAAALEELPAIRKAFGEGKLSYSKVRAMTRVATIDSELDLCDVALSLTASQLEATCAKFRIAKQGLGETESAAAAFASRKVTSRNNHDGTATIVVVLPVDTAKLLAETIDARVDEIVDDATDNNNNTENEVDGLLTRREVVAQRGGLAAMRADAIVDIVTGDDMSTASVTVLTDLATITEPDSQTSSETGTPAHRNPKTGQVPEPGTDPQLGAGSQPGTGANSGVVFKAVTDFRPGSGLDPRLFGGVCEIDGWRIAPEIARRLGCDSQVRLMVTDSHGDPVTEGPQTRVPSRAQRRALNKRDNNTCQFPGCDTSRRLHAHHVVHWINGGPTELENLILLCSFHHHTVHEGGWNITTTTIPGKFVFINPEGTEVGVEVFRGRLTPLINPGRPDVINRLSGRWTPQQPGSVSRNTRHCGAVSLCRS